jgi:hypothetical protein
MYIKKGQEMTFIVSLERNFLKYHSYFEKKIIKINILIKLILITVIYIT